MITESRINLEESHYPILRLTAPAANMLSDSEDGGVRDKEKDEWSKFTFRNYCKTAQGTFCLGTEMFLHPGISEQTS